MWIAPGGTWQCMAQVRNKNSKRNAPNYFETKIVSFFRCMTATAVVIVVVVAIMEWYLYTFHVTTKTRQNQKRRDSHSHYSWFLLVRRQCRRLILHFGLLAAAQHSFNTEKRRNEIVVYTMYVCCVCNYRLNICCFSMYISMVEYNVVVR